MKEIGTRLVSLSGLPQNKRPAPKSEGGPSESFKAGEAGATWLQKPNFDRQAEEPTRSSRQGMSVGHKVALITAGLAAGAGALGVATAHPGPTNPQVQLSTRDASKALNNFQYLQDVVQQQGGTLKSDPSSLLGRVFHHQSEVDASGAVNAMSHGYTVYLYPTAESEGIPIRSTQDLKQITNLAREQVAEQNLKQGLENLKQGLKDLGENLKGEIQDIFR